MSPLKSIFVSFLLVLALVGKSQDTTIWNKFGFSEFQTLATQENGDLRSLAWYSKTREHSIGMWAFGLFVQDLSSDYTFGEGILGANYTTGIFELGLGAGFETAEEPWRASGYIFAMKDKWSGYANAEYGGSGYWHLAFLNYSASKTFAVGVVSQTSAVHGLRLQFSFGDALVWTGFGIGDDAKPCGLLAMRFNY